MLKPYILNCPSFPRHNQSYYLTDNTARSACNVIAQTPATTLATKPVTEELTTPLSCDCPETTPTECPENCLEINTPTESPAKDCPTSESPHSSTDSDAQTGNDSDAQTGTDCASWDCGTCCAGLGISVGAGAGRESSTAIEAVLGVLVIGLLIALVGVVTAWAWTCYRKKPKAAPVQPGYAHTGTYIIL